MNPQTQQEIQRISEVCVADLQRYFGGLNEWPASLKQSVRKVIECNLTELATPLLEKVERLENETIYLKCEMLELHNELNQQISKQTK